MIADPTPAERSVLGAIRYQPNTATLHTDPRMLPTEPRARASWNYAIDPREPARHRHVLDELAAGDRERATTARHAQSLRRDRSRAGSSPSSSISIPSSTPPRCAPSVGATRSKESAASRSRAPTGATGSTRTACRAGSKSRARYRANDERRRDLRGDRAAPTARARRARVRAAPVPRLSRRRRTPGVARSAAGLVGAPSPHRCTSGARTSSTARPHRSATRCATSCTTRLGRRPTGPVFLLAHLRTFGWSFNPVAVYYCWQPDGRALDAVVLEVTNTPWGERHWYVFDARARRHDPDRPEGDARLAVPPDGRRLPRVVDGAGRPPRPRRRSCNEGKRRCSRPVSRLRRTALDRRTAVTVLLRYPLLTLRVSLTIYRQALALFAGRLPLYRHSARSAQEVGA